MKSVADKSGNELVSKAPIRYMNTVSFFHYSSGSDAVERSRRVLSDGSPSSEVRRTDGRREDESEVEWLGELEALEVP